MDLNRRERKSQHTFAASRFPNEEGKDPRRPLPLKFRVVTRQSDDVVEDEIMVTACQSSTQGSCTRSGGKVPGKTIQGLIAVNK